MWVADPSIAETKRRKVDQSTAGQSIDLGNVGEKARIDIKQAQGVDPKELAKVLDMLAKRDADARKAEECVAELEAAEQRRARESGVSRVLTQAALADADDLAKRARVALLQGDSKLAERYLRQQEERAASAAEENRREAAKMAREIAALAIGRDSRAALEALQRAAKYLPEDFLTQVQLGDAQAVLGQSAQAMVSYRMAFDIAERLVAREPGNIKRQLDLAASHIRIGHVLHTQGDGAGALAAYRMGMAITETLITRDPANTESQRELSANYSRIGNVLFARGEHVEALAAYRKGLAIAESLVTFDPANMGWQHDLSVSYIKIGDVLLAQGDRAGALAAYRKGLAIAEKLAARDPANTDWQRDLSVSHNKIGDVLVAQGDGEGALVAYRKSLAIRETLTARDPDNTQWLIDIAMSCAKLGKHTEVPKNERRTYLQRGLEILKALRSKDRLLHNQDMTKGFEEALQALSEERSEH